MANFCIMLQFSHLLRLRDQAWFVLVYVSILWLSPGLWAVDRLPRIGDVAAQVPFHWWVRSKTIQSQKYKGLAGEETYQKQPVPAAGTLVEPWWLIKAVLIEQKPLSQGCIPSRFQYDLLAHWGAVCTSLHHRWVTWLHCLVLKSSGSLLRRYDCLFSYHAGFAVVQLHWLQRSYFWTLPL